MLRRNRSARTSRKLTALIAVAASVSLLGAGVGTPSAEARSCPGTGHITIEANSATSCGFARNMARSFQRGVAAGRISPFSDDDVRGSAYSPTTGRRYTVRCSRGATIGTTVEWRCSAGRGARVVLTYY